MHVAEFYLLFDAFYLHILYIYCPISSVYLFWSENPNTAKFIMQFHPTQIFAFWVPLKR